MQNFSESIIASQQTKYHHVDVTVGAGEETLGASSTNERNHSVEFYHFPETGFSLVPRGQEVSFYPPQGLGDTIYITVVFRQKDGDLTIHSGKQVPAGSRWLITKTGGLVESDPSDPFCPKHLTAEEEKVFKLSLVCKLLRQPFANQDLDSKYLKEMEEDVNLWMRSFAQAEVSCDRAVASMSSWADSIKVI